MELETENDFATREAISDWLAKACADINQNFGNLVLVLASPRWYAAKDDILRKFPITVHYRHRELDKLIFENNSLWKVAEKSAQGNAEIARHINGMIGTAYGMRRRYTLEELFQLMLPIPYPASDTQVEVNTDQDLAKIVDRFLGEIKRAQSHQESSGQ